MFHASTNSQIRSLRRGGKSGALTALIEPPSGYEGDLESFGTATVRCNPDLSFLLAITAEDLDPACKTCKVAIYDGTSCDSPGSAYFDEDTIAEDPFTPWTINSNYYSTYGDGGLSNSAFSFTNGYTCDENEGRVVVMFDDTSKTILGCGVLGEERKTNVLKAQMGPYPEYAGDLDPSGKVTLVFKSDDTFEFFFRVRGLEEDVDAAGLHVHEGTSCDSPGVVLGHHWNENVVRDLWTIEGGSYYSTDCNGKAKGNFNMYNGYGIEENSNHAVVIHAKDGSRVACGVLSYK
jgi:hypothetical protein